MSLRSRVVLLIGLVLFVGIAAGTLVAGYQAKRALSAELSAGLLGGEQTVKSAFEDLPNSDHQARDLRQLVSTFDGNRHIQAALLNADGVVQRSHTFANVGHAPSWFVGLLGNPPHSVELRVPDKVRRFFAVLLTPTPAIDIEGAWQEFSSVVLVLVLSSAAGLVLVHLAIGAALHPLLTLAPEFDRIRAGDYSGRVRENGPPELVGLQQRFNRMAEQLASATERNRQLTDQLVTIQDEERADIARDLHDEIGPYLFSVNMDAELIAQLIAAGRPEATAERVRSIQTAVSHMQRQVRELLGRLRPARVTEFGLNAALADLVRFWRGRRPDVRILLKLEPEEDVAPEPIREAAYRIVQEAVNNAVRHARPETITVCAELQDGGDLVVMVFDDGTENDEPPGVGGFGLIGMRERVGAFGGSLTFGRAAAGGGWSVVARLPLLAAVSGGAISEVVK